MVSPIVVAEARPPRRPPRTSGSQPPQPVPAPTIVPTDAATLQNNLRRLRIYVLQGPAGSRAFGAEGVGARIWFVLPSCRPQDNRDVVDACPIERLELEARGAGTVHAAPMTTVLDGEIPRRVQAFVVSPETQLVGIRLVNQRGQVRYEGLFDATQLRELPRPEGREASDGSFALDLTRYPAR